jgi:hypothetical protein
VILATAQAAAVSKLELAAPFLITILIITVSVGVYNEIAQRLELYFAHDWTQEELDEVDPDRAPSSYALASVWAMDAAQIPTIIGTPAASLFILHKNYTTGFLVFYTGVLTFGLMFFFYFLRQVRIHRYSARGLRLAGFRISLLALGGIGFNGACAIIAAYVVQ